MKRSYSRVLCCLVELSIIFLMVILFYIFVTALLSLVQNRWDNQYKSTDSNVELHSLVEQVNIGLYVGQSVPTTATAKEGWNRSNEIGLIIS